MFPPCATPQHPRRFSRKMAERLVIATRNAHKVFEIREILGTEFAVEDLSSIPDAPEVEETGATFEDNALLKALAISKCCDAWVAADDSGLEVDALGGAPGVYSARFSGPGATDASNRTLLLEKLSGIRGKARSARFRCAIALARKGEKHAVFHGAVEGVIVNSEKGSGGFGYDSLFVPEGYCETFAELDAAVKNSLSHRARALAGLRSWPGWRRGFSAGL
jgi:XTP/dITP diphosphohydrolase